MAKAMSQAILGKQIDGVWHTGVVVYGTEYFYGGGIQSARPGCTVAGTPTRVIDLGATQVEQTAFHSWLRSVSHKYGPHTYNIVTNNCNNFSDEVSKYLRGKPIPSFITGLPQEALNTPLGQMFKPMLEGMQRQMSQMGQNVVPWGSGSLNLPMINPSPPTAPIAAAQPAPLPAPKAGAAGGSSDGKDSKTVTATHPHDSLSLLVLKASSRPLINKTRDHDQYVRLIVTYNNRLASKNAPATMPKDTVDSLKASAGILGDGDKPLPPAAAAALDTLIASWPPKLLFPVLGALQGALLRPAQRDRLAKNYGKVVPRLLALLPGGDGPLANEATQTAALCTFCNMFGGASAGGASAGGDALARRLVGDADFVAMLVESVGSESSELIRSTAARLAYNACLAMPKNADDEGVVMLASLLPSACVEAKSQPNGYRLMLALGQLMLRNSDVCELVQSMGFEPDEVVTALAAAKPKTLARIKALAKDMDAMLALV